MKTIWARVGLAMCLGSALAVVLRIILPPSKGISLHLGNVVRVMSIDKVAFWMCLLITVIIGVLLVRR